jgi:hypothetical protein
VGLPNELTYSFRLAFLLGKPYWKGYMPYWHKHFFTIDEIEKFIKKFFKKYDKKEYLGAFTGANFLPFKVRDFMAKNMPTLFAKEVYYIIRVK